MAYFRNAVRSEIIPFLERYNPRLKRALFNLSEHMREDFRFIEEAVSAASAMVKIPGSGHVRVKIEDIAVQPSAVQKEILRNSLEKAGGKIKKLSFRHWKEMESIIRRKGKGSSLDLPGGIRIEHTGDSLIFGRIPDALR
jgi:tRNA(Ile)-lysidine synthase